jgi:uncharacterized membrane protein (DUF2068 family)
MRSPRHAASRVCGHGGRGRPPALTLGRVRRERGLVVIIAYKLGKGGLWLVLAVVLFVLIQMGLGDELLNFAEHLRHHAHAWSLELAQLVVRAASRRALWTIVVALVADGAFSLVEGWALLHGRWWGPWLVVVGSGSLVPFEVWALARHPHVVRAALLAVNVVIVLYLSRKAMRELQERATRRSPS